MNKPLELRFIPKWLGDAIRYHQTNYDNFERIVSRHDLNMYRVANNLMQTTLKKMFINDFVLPDAVLTSGFSEDDAVFALFGQNPSGLTVPAFELKHFIIVPDQSDGILLVETNKDEDKNLVAELLLAIALYQGKDQAYASSTFKRYLTLVNKNAHPLLSPDGVLRFQNALKQKMAEDATRNAAEAAKEDS